MHDPLARHPLLLSLALLMACSGAEPGPSPVPGGVSAVVTDSLIGIGDTTHVKVTVLDTLGDTIPSAHVIFVSTAPGIAAVSGQGKVTGVASGVDTIQVQAGAFQAVVIVSVHPDRVKVSGYAIGVAVSSTGKVYATMVNDSPIDSLAAISLGPDSVLHIYAVGNSPGDVVIDASGSVVYVANFDDHTVYRMTVADGHITDSADVGGEAYRVRLSADGSYLYVTSGDMYLYKLNAANLARVDSIETMAAPNGLLLKGDTLAYVSSSIEARVEELDLQGDSVVRSVTGSGTWQDVALSADQEVLYVANEAGGRVEVIDLVSGTLEAPITGVEQAFGLALTAGGDTLFVSSLDGVVRKIAPSTGAILHTYPVGGEPRRLARAPDGTIVVGNEGRWVDVIR